MQIQVPCWALGSHGAEHRGQLLACTLRPGVCRVSTSPCEVAPSLPLSPNLQTLLPPLAPGLSPALA